MHFIIKRSVLSSRKDRKQRYCSLLIAHFSLVLLICSCDLFTGPKTDLFQKISDEVDWANAARVSVTVMYPQEWGTSTQRGTGRCINHLGTLGDIRVGYPFEVDFQPIAEYAMTLNPAKPEITGWRAYRTADLAKINWQEEPARLQNIPQIDRVSLPVVDEGGGKGLVTLYSSEAVTLIPFCRAQPRIVSCSLTGEYYSRGRQIVIRFAAPLYDATAVLGPDKVEITCDPAPGGNRYIDGQFSSAKRYTIFYQSSNNSIVLTPVFDYTNNIDGPPAESLITIRLGSELKTTMGASWENPVTLSFKTRPSNARVDTWRVKYNSSGTGKIEVSWTLDGEAAVRVSYRQLGSTSYYTAVAPSGLDKKSHEFTGITAFTGSNGQGYQIKIETKNNVNSVETWQDVFDTESPIKIWNVHGMESSSDNEIIEVIDMAGLNNMRNGLNRTYVLTAAANTSYTSSSQWNPVGNSSAPFSGKFYGMGKTITFNNGVRSVTDAGLFGCVNGALIRDVMVDYKATTLEAISHFGGIAGNSKGTIISRAASAGSITVNNGGGCYVGGLIGYANDSASSITNCHSTADVEVTGDTPSIGGLLGYAWSGQMTISQCYATGNVKAIVKNSAIAGGLIGYTRKVTIIECYATGKVTIETKPRTGAGYLYGGGLIGYLSADSLIEDSYATGNVEIDNPYTPSGTIGAGGLVGLLTSSYYNYGNSVSRIQRCFATGSVHARGTSATGGVYSGGIFGVQDSGDGAFTNCVALNQKITAIGGHGSPFSARIYGYKYSNVLNGTNNYALAGMTLNTASSYTSPAIIARTPASNSSGQDGADLPAAAGTWSTWINIGFNAANSRWSATNIGTRGYPRLAWE
ncbi:MAG: hypothetical protein LBU85_10510 [Treponema sp.]|jgi:hypothetical protein|nr:hypothetical protein [Treponema sp.]